MGRTFCTSVARLRQHKTYFNNLQVPFVYVCNCVTLVAYVFSLYINTEKERKEGKKGGKKKGYIVRCRRKQCDIIFSVIRVFMTTSSATSCERFSPLLIYAFPRPRIYLDNHRLRIRGKGQEKGVGEKMQFIRRGGK